MIIPIYPLLALLFVVGNGKDLKSVANFHVHSKSLLSELKDQNFQSIHHQKSSTFSLVAEAVSRTFRSLLTFQTAQRYDSKSLVPSDVELATLDSAGYLMIKSYLNSDCSGDYYYAESLVLEKCLPGDKDSTYFNYFFIKNGKLMVNEFSTSSCSGNPVKTTRQSLGCDTQGEVSIRLAHKSTFTLGGKPGYGTM